MTCPNIYLGTGRFGAGPLPGEYGNDSIILASYNVTQSATVFGQLRVNNHGTDNSPATTVELYWSDPATNFAAVFSQRIFQLTNVIVPGATGGGVQGEFIQNWSYAFPTVGHFCLLARLENSSPPSGAGCVQQAYNELSPPTDPQSAIHNINVIAPPPPPPSPGGGGGGAGAGGRMGFAFAAVNMQRDVEKTFIEVDVLDPGKDKAKLQHLVSIPGIYRALAQRHVKFAEPNGVQLGEGRERILYRHEHFAKENPTCAPRMRVRGEVDAATIKRMLVPGSKLADIKGKHELDLLYGEARQTFIQVEPCGKEHAAYAVEVTHKAENGRIIGGLVCIFVPPHKFF